MRGEVLGPSGSESGAARGAGAAAGGGAACGAFADWTRGL